jgi:catechol 2,3-dioxygenase-like lactoylglutathione lyase family enzyme
VIGAHTDREEHAMTTSSATKIQPALNHVAISVLDAERATRFYTEVLGLAKLPRPDFGVGGAWLAAGPAMVHLAETNEIPEPRDPVGHFAFKVPTEQIAPLAKAVEAGGGKLLFGPSSRVDFGREVTTAFCVDTEGNKFEITDA